MRRVAAGCRTVHSDCNGMTGRTAFGCVSPDGGCYSARAVNVGVAGSSRTGAGVTAVGGVFDGQRIAVGDCDGTVGVAGGRYCACCCSGIMAIGAGCVVMFGVAAGGRAG